MGSDPGWDLWREVVAAVLTMLTMLAGFLARYAWTQGRKVDTLFQSLYGAPHSPGLLLELQELESKFSTLIATVATLNVTVEILTRALDERRTILDRQPERRSS